MNAKHLFALAMLSAVVSGAEAAESPARAVLDRDLPKLLSQYKIPSVSVAQIRRGRVVLTAAYGAQSPGVRATTATLYNIASLTKPLSAEVILRLASKGQLGLDDAMYLSWLDPDIASDPRAKLLTPRLVLSHRSGLPNWRAKTGLAFVHDPGAQVGYSGEGFEYVARFTQKKTGQAFTSLAQAVLFDPAGMKDTSYAGKLWFDGRIAVPTSAVGASLKPLIASEFNAADLVYTTAGDYARFMTGVLKDEGLSPAIARERNRIQTDDFASTCAGAKAASCPRAVGFGLGWQILEFKGETVMMHTGKDDGLFTFAYVNRTTGDGAVILSNGEEGYNLIIPILERLRSSQVFVSFLKGQIAG